MKLGEELGPGSSAHILLENSPQDLSLEADIQMALRT